MAVKSLAKSGKKRPVEKLLLVFLGVWTLLIVFVRSESFVRWYDDPKEVIFYGGMLVLFLWRFRRLKTTFFAADSWPLATVLAVCFLFYLPLNIALSGAPLNEALAVSGKYALCIAGLSSLSLESAWLHLRWARMACLILVPAVLLSFYFKRTDLFIEPLGYVPYYCDTLALTLPLFIFFGFCSRSRAQNIFFSVSTLLLIAAILMTGRKSGFVVLCLNIVVLVYAGPFFFRRRGSWKSVWIISLAVALALIVMLGLNRTHLLSSATAEN